MIPPQLAALLGIDPASVEGVEALVLTIAAVVVGGILLLGLYAKSQRPKTVGILLHLTPALAAINRSTASTGISTHVVPPPTCRVRGVEVQVFGCFVLEGPHELSAAALNSPVK